MSFKAVIPKPPKVQRVSVKNWLHGTVTAFDDGRTPTDGLRSSGNVLLNQDGTIGPRPSLTLFGPQPTGTILGEIYEFRAVTGLTATNYMASMQKVGINEVQTLAITGTPTGGTFTLTYSGQTTSAIAYNASAATVQAALVALSNVGTGQVTCTGGALPGASVVITFGGTLANTDVAAITSSSSLTGGTSPAIAITETTKGGYTTSVYVAKPEDSVWTKCTGKTYDNTASARFCQIGNKVLVMNGTDNLSYIDIAGIGTPAITPFTSLSTPSAPTLTTNTGLTGTTFNIYYAITANSTVGETAGSPALTVQVSTDRDLWNPTSQNITIGWSAVTSAKSYNLYMAISAPGGVPTLYLIKSNIDAGTLSFKDDGSLAQDTTRPLPTVDSTAGPRGSRASVINGRVFMVGDSDHPYYVRYGGDYGFELDFSPANGGGFTPIGNGTKEIPANVKPFRDGKGTPQITVLCQGTNGHGKRYIMAPNSLTVGTTVINFYDVTEDNGADGTDSPDGVITYHDSLWYPSRDGFKTTGTKPQLQNVLSTDRVSNTIQPDIKTLNNASMGKCVGLAYEGRLYWSVPVNNSTNNEIWVLDLDRGGAWMKPWSVSIDWMLLINDNSGVTHFVVLSNNQIMEFSYLALTADNGTSFLTEGQSGVIPFSPDSREWGKLIQLIFVILRPQGNMNFTVAGKTEDDPLVTVGTASLSAGAATAEVGWGEAAWSSYAWSSFPGVPASFNPEQIEVPVEVDEDLQWFTYSWGSTGSGVAYQLSDVIAEFVPLGIRDLT